MKTSNSQLVISNVTKKGKKIRRRTANPQKLIEEDRVTILETRILELERRLNTLLPADTSIGFEVKFFGGAGEIQFLGQNVDRKEREATSFFIMQSKNKQRVDVVGTAPQGTNGSIEVQITQDTDILSPFSSNVFKNLINSVITYTVK